MQLFSVAGKKNEKKGKSIIFRESLAENKAKKYV